MFENSNDTAQLQHVARSLDFILSVGHDLDWNACLGTLRPKGKLCIIGISANPINIEPFQLMFGQLTAPCVRVVVTCSPQRSSTVWLLSS